jgi:hypothetical protein
LELDHCQARSRLQKLLAVRAQCHGRPSIVKDRQYRDGHIGQLRIELSDLCGAGAIVTSAVKRACDARDRCEFFVDAARIGDPVNSCGKDFSVEYRCTGSEVVQRAYLPGEAHGHRLILNCTEPK